MTDPTPRLRSTDPADGGLVAEFDVDGSEQVAAAVARAREASTWWAGLGFADRERRLLRWAAHLTRHARRSPRSSAPRTASPATTCSSNSPSPWSTSAGPRATPARCCVPGRSPPAR
nr:aldehyde dehydrogenase family protein [Saccharopolyspora gregorii]